MRVEGGAGDDALIDGAGDDTFVFYSINDGDDMILDFILTEDTVDMDALFDAPDADQGGYATEAEREAALRFEEVDTDNDLVNDALMLTVIARAIRLYEQEPGEAHPSARLGMYVRRWVRWTGAGLAVADIPAQNVISGGLTQ